MWSDFQESQKTKHFVLAVFMFVLCLFLREREFMEGIVRQQVSVHKGRTPFSRVVQNIQLFKRTCRAPPSVKSNLSF